MKWSLSEIKKHATPVPNGNPLVIKLLKDLAKEQKVKLQQWVPLEDIINLENELREKLAYLTEKGSVPNTGVLRTLKEILG